MRNRRFLFFLRFSGSGLWTFFWHPALDSPLSTLPKPAVHQLRGRVGRGAAKSYCVLLVGEQGHGREARERLAIMEQTADGFRIAQKDLELRGPGAVYGSQQHGLSDLQFLTVILQDAELVAGARREAQALVAGGAEAREAMRGMLGSLRGGWKKRLELARVG